EIERLLENEHIESLQHGDVQWPGQESTEHGDVALRRVGERSSEGSGGEFYFEAPLFATGKYGIDYLDDREVQNFFWDLERVGLEVEVERHPERSDMYAMIKVTGNSRTIDKARKSNPDFDFDYHSYQPPKTPAQDDLKEAIQDRTGQESTSNLATLTLQSQLSGNQDPHNEFDYRMQWVFEELDERGIDYQIGPDPTKEGYGLVTMTGSTEDFESLVDDHKGLGKILKLPSKQAATGDVALETMVLRLQLMNDGDPNIKHTYWDDWIFDSLDEEGIPYELSHSDNVEYGFVTVTGSKDQIDGWLAERSAVNPWIQERGPVKGKDLAFSVKLREYDMPFLGNVMPDSRKLFDYVESTSGLTPKIERHPENPWSALVKVEGVPPELYQKLTSNPEIRNNLYAE
ncbi:MAG: hypothetical protein ABIE22_00115, partial [archaeon]